MKSVVQEASSIAKAIEQGLQKANNPRDFAVKILEYPEKNFFGLTTKPAKIALYYDDRVRKSHEPYSSNNPASEQSEHRHQDQGRHQKPSLARPTRTQQRNEQSSYQKGERRSVAPQQAAETGQVLPESQMDHPHLPRRSEEPIVPRWTPETTRHAKEWLTRVLTEMHRLVPFTIEAQNLCLRIVFERPLFNDPEHERKVLASLSLLIIETSKHVFKLNLRGHKVLLTHRS